MRASPVQPSGQTRGAVCLLACVALLLVAAVIHLWYLIDSCPLVAHIIAFPCVVLADISQRLVGSEAPAVRVPAGALLGALCSGALFPYVMRGQFRFLGIETDHKARLSNVC